MTNSMARIGIAIVVAFLLAATHVTSQAPSPWVDTYTPARTLYVSPSGTGVGTESDPMSLASAMSGSVAGDLIWLTAGTYAGALELANDGTVDAPIVYRAFPGHHVVVNGAFRVTGAHTWIWGLEITDPGNIAPPGFSGINMFAPGIHAINNVIHHQVNKNGLTSFNSSPNTVTYGNIVYDSGEGPSSHPHNVYAQNSLDQHDFKYFVNNMLLDSADMDPQSYNFHGYTTNGTITGLHVQGNIVKNGRFLIGGVNEPVDRHVVVGNYFYGANVRFGYRRPAQVEFRNNLLVRSSLDCEQFWGAGEVLYTQTLPNVFTGNEFLGYEKPSWHLQVRTSAYIGSPPTLTSITPALQPTDVFDNNIYATPFSARLGANGSDRAVGFEEWKANTAAAGNAFDVNSQLIAPPTGVRVALLPNEYEAGRAHLAVFNWDLLPDVTVDLSAVLADGTQFQIYSARDTMGAPLVSGTYSGPVVIPTASKEFFAYLVTSGVQEPGPDPEPDPEPEPEPEPEPGITGTGTIVDDDEPAPPPVPIIGLSDSSAQEGDVGNTPMGFTVTLSEATTVEVSVDYRTTEGTATEGVDYVGASGSLTFAPGETEKVVSVDVVGDLEDEPDETFSLDLSSPANATF